MTTTRHRVTKFVAALSWTRRLLGHALLLEQANLRAEITAGLDMPVPPMWQSHPRVRAHCTSQEAHRRCLERHVTDAEAADAIEQQCDECPGRSSCPHCNVCEAEAGRLNWEVGLARKSLSSWEDTIDAARALGGVASTCLALRNFPNDVAAIIVSQVFVAETGLQPTTVLHEWRQLVATGKRCWDDKGWWMKNCSGDQVKWREAESCQMPRCAASLTFGARHHCRYCGCAVCGDCLGGQLDVHRWVSSTGAGVSWIDEDGETHRGKPEPARVACTPKQVCALCKQYAPAEIRRSGCSGSRISPRPQRLRPTLMRIPRWQKVWRERFPKRSP